MPAAREHIGIARAIAYLVREQAGQPRMTEAARAASMTPAAFSRSFKRHVGIGPKRFLAHLTIERLKQRLADGAGPMEAQLDSGLSSGSRVHDHFVHLEAVTPGQFRKAGQGMTIQYGFHDSPYGDCLIARTGRGICFVAFAGLTGGDRALAEMERSWPSARIIKAPEATSADAIRLFTTSRSAISEPCSVHVRGTNFQVQVWRALLRIPPGRLASYGQLARFLGRPGSSRAVAGAVAANPVALIIPCHRIIRSSGQLSGYRWLPAVKARMVVNEALENP